MLIRRVPGFSDYAVSRKGHLFSKRQSRGKEWRRLKPHPHEYGHMFTMVVNDDGLSKCMGVHQLVMLAFKGPPPPGQQVRHKDGKGSNNNLDNLEYGTPKQNKNDSIKHGTAYQGGHAPKYTKEAALKYLELKAKGLLNKDIAVLLGIKTPSNLYSRLKRWKRCGWLP